MDNKKRLELWFSMYEISYWALSFIMDGAYGSYLKSLGYGEAFIGRTLTALGLASLILMPLGGYLADRVGKYKTLTAVSSVLICGMLFAVSIVASDAVVYLYAVIGGGFTRLLSGFLDSWITKMSKEEPGLDYGRIRSMGSISYALSSPVFGQLFTRLGFKAQIPLGAVLLVLCLICSAKLRDPSLGEKEEKGPSFKEAMGYLLGNRTYLIFLGCSFIMNLSMQSLFGFIGLRIEEAGGTVGSLGIFYFVLAMIEFFVVRNYTAVLNRLGMRKTVLLGMFGTFLKPFLISLAPSVGWIYCCAVTQAISLALTVPTNAVYQGRCVDKRYLSTALLVMQTCCTGLITFLFSSLFGRIAEQYGCGSMIRIFSFFSLIAMVLFWIFAPKDGEEEVSV